MKLHRFFCLSLLLCTVGTQAWAEIKLEAEKATYSKCDIVSDKKYSGGKALKLTDEKAKITFEVDIKQKSKYTLYVGGDGIGGEKTINCSVNGGTAQFKLNGYKEVEVGTFMMDKGKNTVVITPSWTWFDIDYLRLDVSQSSISFDISDKPVDANATEAACKMYSFLYDNFGKKTISGMMTGDMGSANGNVTQHDDIKAVYEVSGKYPALVGLDFLFATGRTENEGWCKDYTKKAVELAKDTYRRGGFPAFTWHWHDPSYKTDDFYSDKMNMSISDALNIDGSWNTASAIYKNIVHDIDVIADYFLELQNEGMACIFRPLHEASGGWFWWGRNSKAEDFVKLYQLMFDEMTDVKGVHNVLWVWNAGTEDADWNPGEDYYDIVSADIYNNFFDYSSNYPTFDKLKTLTGGKKIIALSENGPIPDIDKQMDDEAMWSWWMPWYQTWGGNFVNQTSKEEWQKVMNDGHVVTLDDQKDWNSIEALITAPDQLDIFTLYGYKLKQAPAQGMFIRNGKKYMK